MTYALIGAPSGVTIDPATGAVQIPTSLPAGIYSWKRTVTDGVSTAPSAQTITLTVTQSPVTPGSPSVTGNDITNLIVVPSGLDPTTLEVSVNGGANYTAFVAGTTYL